MSEDASRITAVTRCIAIIGDPIEHSMTPVLQNAALRELGANIVNIAFHVHPEQLAEAVRGAQALGILGIMVTIPHKAAIIDLLDEVDEFGRLMGAVNLVHFADGKRIGYNTDGYGASRSLQDAGVDVRGSRILVIGAGGAGRCLVHRFCLDGAEHVYLVNRTIERAAAIRDEVASKQGRTITVGPLDENFLRELLLECTIVVNTTSLGMIPHIDASPVPQHLWTSRHLAFDIVYNPLETRFLAEARAAGAGTIDGVGMLVYTNERAVQVCAGLTPSVATMRKACLDALTARSYTH